MTYVIEKNVLMRSMQQRQKKLLCLMDQLMSLGYGLSKLKCSTGQLATKSVWEQASDVQKM